LLRQQQDKEVTKPPLQEPALKQIARISPIRQLIPEPADFQPDTSLPPHNSSPRAIPVIDISDEDTVSYNEYFDFYEPVEEQHPEVIDLTSRSPNDNDNEFRDNPLPEIIDLEPNLPNDQRAESDLEPLDPDPEYRRNIHRMFITLDEYARTAYLTTYGT